MNNINSEEVKAIPLELPSLEEQKVIVHRVEALFAIADRLETRYLAAKDFVDDLTPALLSKAFRGELIPQDPNDEPVSLLLERIRSAKALTLNEKKPNRRTGMSGTKSQKESKRSGILQALQENGIEFSTEELFKAAGYPADAESALVEEFFVELREAMEKHLINKRRTNDADWFALARQ